MSEREADAGARDVRTMANACYDAHHTLNNQSVCVRCVAAALQAQRGQQAEQAAQIAEEWTKHPCRSHDDDPCCHARTGRAIADAIRRRAASPAPAAGQQEDLICHRCEHVIDAQEAGGYLEQVALGRIRLAYHAGCWNDRQRVFENLAAASPAMRAYAPRPFGTEPRGCPTPGACSCPAAGVSDEALGQVAYETDRWGDLPWAALTPEMRESWISIAAAVRAALAGGQG